MSSTCTNIEAAFSGLETPRVPHCSKGGGAGEEGIPSYDSRLSRLCKTFTTAFERATPDFQSKNGYGVDPPGQADMTIASNAVRSSPGLLLLVGLSIHRALLMAVERAMGSPSIFFAR